MGSPRLDRLDRNFFINGGMDYWQRAGATSLTITNSFIHWADRWAIGMGGTWTTPLGLRDIDVPSVKSKYSYKVTGTPTIITDSMVWRQKVESIFARAMAGKKASISIKVKSNNMKGVRIRLATADIENDFSAITSFLDTHKSFTDDSTWQTIKFENIDIPAGAVRGIDCKIDVDDVTGLIATIINVGEIKFNIGEFAQEFSLAGRDSVEEFQLCQRYYHKPGFDDQDSRFSFGLVHPKDANSGQMYVYFPVTMQAKPTFSKSSTSLLAIAYGNADVNQATINSLNLQRSYKSHMEFSFGSASVLGLDNFNILRRNGSTGWIAFDAEL